VGGWHKVQLLHGLSQKFFIFSIAVSMCGLFERKMKKIVKNDEKWLNLIKM
jgi:hypothetical protein